MLINLHRTSSLVTRAYEYWLDLAARVTNTEKHDAFSAGFVMGFEACKMQVQLDGGRPHKENTEKENQNELEQV